MLSTGINGTIAGSRAGIDAIHSLLLSQGFDNLEYKESSSESKPFQRMKLKLKKEIVTLGVKVKPLERVGHYLDPKEWNDLLKRDDVVVIDTRNDYECKVGTFKNAVNPMIGSFADFPEFVKQNDQLQQAKNENTKKKVAMFCTGGIRCEKSTSYMLQEGYEEVYHLKGGILKYLEETPVEESLWDGECFVFDNRTCVTHGLAPGTSEVCLACGWPITPEERSHESYEKGVSCVECFSKTTQKQKEGFRMRQKQLELTELRQLQLDAQNNQEPGSESDNPKKKKKSQKQAVDVNQESSQELSQSASDEVVSA